MTNDLSPHLQTPVVLYALHEPKSILQESTIGMLAMDDHKISFSSEDGSEVFRLPLGSITKIDFSVRFSQSPQFRIEVDDGTTYVCLMDDNMTNGAKSFAMTTNFNFSYRRDAWYGVQSMRMWREAFEHVLPESKIIKPGKFLPIFLMVVGIAVLATFLIGGFLAFVR